MYTVSIVQPSRSVTRHGKYTTHRPRWATMPSKASRTWSGSNGYRDIRGPRSRTGSLINSDSTRQRLSVPGGSPPTARLFDIRSPSRPGQFCPGVGIVANRKTFSQSSGDPSRLRILALPYSPRVQNLHVQRGALPFAFGKYLQPITCGSKRIL